MNTQAFHAETKDSPEIIRAATRGSTLLDWLDSKHTFSFGSYYDPARMGFRTLRVINDDRIAPGGGFGTHPHRDMEIITVVLSGALQHRDSLGSGEVLRPGDVQVMTAGRGIEHSEFNSSKSEEVHLIQIWIMPERRGLAPAYNQKHFPPTSWTSALVRVAGQKSTESDGALKINQDVDLYRGSITAGHELPYSMQAGRSLFLHVATGSVLLDSAPQTSIELKGGDAIALPSSSNQVRLQIAGVSELSEVLLFDLA